MFLPSLLAGTPQEDGGGAASTRPTERLKADVSSIPAADAAADVAAAAALLAVRLKLVCLMVEEYCGLNYVIVSTLHPLLVFYFIFCEIVYRAHQQPVCCHPMAQSVLYLTC